MKHRKASVSWQNDTVELSRKKQVVKSCIRTGYTRASHRQIIVKTDIPDCPFYDVRLTTNHILWQCSDTCNERDECGIQSSAWKEGRVRHQETGEIYQENWSLQWDLENEKN
jgi:hypothetical protein